MRCPSPRLADMTPRGSGVTIGVLVGGSAAGSDFPWPSDSAIAMGGGLATTAAGRSSFGNASGSRSSEALLGFASLVSLLVLAIW